MSAKADRKGAHSRAAMRLDQLLVFLRFARTRSIASSMIEAGHMRLNSQRVTKISHEVCVGDVLTLTWRGEVCVAQIDTLPERRLSPADAALAWSRIA